MEHFEMQDIFSVAGKKAIVTGGTKGLGRAMATCLLDNGCDVMLVSRSAGDLAELTALAEEKSVRCLHHACDITDTAAVRAMAAAAEEAFGRIDILINSAGMNIVKMMEDMDDGSWDTVLDLNLKAGFVVMREVVKIMRKNRYGKIINISSMKSVMGTSTAGYTAYCASKGAINMLTKQVACEVAADGITVNAIAPTFIKTDINAHQLEDPVFYRSLTDRIPVGRIGTFRDLAGLTLLLASDASQFITGQTIMLDGGITARQ